MGPGFLTLGPGFWGAGLQGCRLWETLGVSASERDVAGFGVLIGGYLGPCRLCSRFQVSTPTPGFHLAVDGCRPLTCSMPSRGSASTFFSVLVEGTPFSRLVLFRIMLRKAVIRPATCYPKAKTRCDSSSIRTARNAAEHGSDVLEIATIETSTDMMATTEHGSQRSDTNCESKRRSVQKYFAMVGKQHWER